MLLAVINMSYSNDIVNHNVVELWEIYDNERLLKKFNFEYSSNVKIILGCFEITFKNVIKNEVKSHIYKAIIKYQKCNLIIELYSENNLIEKYQLDYKNDYFSFIKHNLIMSVESF
jgi:hypothetical protein